MVAASLTSISECGLLASVMRNIFDRHLLSKVQEWTYTIRIPSMLRKHLLKTNNIFYLLLNVQSTKQ